MPQLPLGCLPGLAAAAPDAAIASGTADWSLLHYAAAGGDLGCLQTLLARGMSPNAATSGGATPLELAASPDVASLACMKELIEWGADIGRAEASVRAALTHTLPSVKGEGECNGQAAGLLLLWLLR